MSCSPLTRPAGALCFRLAALALLALCVLSPGAAGEAPAFHADFRAAPFWYRAGFDAGEISGAPDPADPRWHRAAWRENGPFTAREMDIPLPPAGPVFPPRNPAEMEFTLLFSFEISGETWAALRSGRSFQPGLYLDALGDNWEIYLNGASLRREIFLDRDGSIRVHRALTRIAIPVFSGDLVAGTNWLALRFLGNPRSRTTGFFSGGLFYAGDFRLMPDRLQDALDALLCGILLLAALSFFWIFSLRREETGYFYLGGSALAYLVYFLAGSGLLAGFVPDTDRLLRISLAGLFMVLPLYLLHAESPAPRIAWPGEDARPAARRRLSLKIYTGLCALLSALALAGPAGAGESFRMIAPVAFVPAALFALAGDFVMTYILAATDAWRQNQSEKRGESRINVWLSVLGDRPEGWRLAVFVLLLGVALPDWIGWLAWNRRPLFTRFGIPLFAAFSVLALIRRIVPLQDSLAARDRKLALADQAAEQIRQQLAENRTLLDRKVRELSQAHTRIAVNNQHYQSLFEGSPDPLAILDGNMRFVRANPAAVRLFHLEFVDLENRTTLIPVLADRLYRDAPNREILIEEFWNMVYAFRLNKSPVEIAAFIASAGPPFTIRLEYRLSPDTGFEIFVRVAFPVAGP